MLVWEVLQISEHTYFARSYELKKGKQKTLIPIERKPRDNIFPITVPNRWVSGVGSSIVCLFSKTSSDIVCPHFWELKAWTGCPFNCSYCYLQGTFRGAKRKKPRIKDKHRIIKFLAEFLSWADSVGLRTLLNAGEIADSLAVPEFVRRFLEMALPILDKHPDHKILFLTKGGTKHIKVLEEIPPNMRDRFIISFSINPQAVAKRYEHGAADPLDRINAAQIALEMGFEVRIRIDPIIPVEGWILYYTQLIDVLLDKVNPSRITIGSLRALKKTINFTHDNSWLEYIKMFPERTSWGLRVEHKLRVRMFSIIIETLKSRGYKGYIALCKEPYTVWSELHQMGLLNSPGKPTIWENVMCNCKL